MAGADNADFGRLVNFAGAEATGARLRLASINGPVGHPAQAAVFQPAEDG